MSDFCREAVDLLYHYLDGELAEEHTITIRRHLVDCPPCYSALDFETELRVVIAHKAKEQVPDNLRRRVFDAIAELEE
jgi:mycothiol system anti-sigma-R factor